VLLHQVSCKLRCIYIVCDGSDGSMQPGFIPSEMNVFGQHVHCGVGTMKFHLLVVVNCSHLFIFFIWFTFGNGKVHRYFASQVVAGLCWFFPTRCRCSARIAARNRYPRWTGATLQHRADNIQMPSDGHQNFYYYKLWLSQRENNFNFLSF